MRLSEISDGEAERVKVVPRDGQDRWDVTVDGRHVPPSTGLQSKAQAERVAKAWRERLTQEEGS